MRGMKSTRRDFDELSIHILATAVDCDLRGISMYNTDEQF
jgi:hypothetical protein